MLEKTVKEAYLVNITIPNSCNLQSTKIEKLQKCTGLKAESTSLWQLNTVYVCTNCLYLQRGFSQKIKGYFKTTGSSHSSIHFQAEIRNIQYVQYSSYAFGRKMNKKCLVRHLNSFKTS